MDSAAPQANLGTEDIGIGLYGLLSHLDSTTLTGAIAGAVVFVISANDFHWLKRLLLGSVALVSGYICAPEATGLIKALLPAGSEVHNGVGAVFSAAMIVRILLAASGKEGIAFLSRFRGVNK
ncbi:putative holin [Erwinia sp. BNK-24-b]|uniref:putative holin n=1 Tax=unclassified Erwinia TaxID=2622719 RepID=UPI0039BFA6C7